MKQWISHYWKGLVVIILIMTMPSLQLSYVSLSLLPLFPHLSIHPPIQTDPEPVVFPVGKSIDSACDTLMSRGQKMAFGKTVQDHRGSCLLPARMGPSVVWTGKGLDPVCVVIHRVCLHKSLTVVCANTRHQCGYTMLKDSHCDPQKKAVYRCGRVIQLKTTLTAELGYYQTAYDSI